MKVIKFLMHRAALTTLLVFVQIAAIILSVIYISEYFWYLYFVLQIISILVVLRVVNNDQDPTTKLPWLAIVLLVPPFGTLIYLLFHNNKPRKKQLKLISRINNQLKTELKTKEAVLKDLKAQDSRIFGQMSYLIKQSGSPVYQNTEVAYFDSGEAYFENLVTQLKQAKKYIFMEYFIFERGKMWNEIYTILQQKASENVEIIIMYDDIGSIYKLPYNFNKKISGDNITVVKFNKYKPIISAVHNNRDHRKITIIDGQVAFTGGINIADEYINQKKRFGHWKDSGVMLKGQAVESLTLSFLKQYFIQIGKTFHVGKYLPVRQNIKSQGFVQPFFDGPYPLYKDRVGENAYLNMINQAQKYIYITTPYLIIDFNFMSALKLAAKRGVEVVIITPHIPDKKIIFLQTQASYRQLLNEGVKIYEYLPGFMHSKNILCDDKFAIVGTFNIDYRSFVHHYENGILLYDVPCLKDIKKDIQNTISQSKEIKHGNYKFGFFKKMFSDLISIFSALM